MNDPIAQANENLHQVLLTLQEEVIRLREQAHSNQRALQSQTELAASSKPSQVKRLMQQLEQEKANKELFCKQRDSKQRDIVIFQRYVKERDAKIADLNHNLSVTLEELKKTRSKYLKLKKENDVLAKLHGKILKAVESWNRRSFVKKAFNRLKLPK